MLDHYPLIMTRALGKLYSALLNSRLSILADAGKIPAENQQGIRSKRNIISNIFTTQRFREECHSKLQQSICVFLDFSRAFD